MQVRGMDRLRTLGLCALVFAAVASGCSMTSSSDSAYASAAARGDSASPSVLRQPATAGIAATPPLPVASPPPPQTLSPGDQAIVEEARAVVVKVGGVAADPATVLVPEPRNR